MTSEEGAALPGVTVVAQSPNLQDRRRATTFATGEYFLPFLPSGSYVVRFELRGMQPVERAITLLAAGSGRLDVAMQPEKIEESVTVSADAQAGTPLETTQVLSSYRKTLTDQLPITRSLRSIALLAPGVTDNGPNGNIGSANTRPALVLSGAQSFESLFLVDGAVVNENLRGQPQDLFIEDAIQDTTVLTGSISSEYGRFTGGVVNVATRSGGNQFHGSFRTNFSSDGWRDLDPIEAGLAEDPRIDRVDESYEATLGGSIWKDRLWFFAAGRSQSVSDSKYIFFPEDETFGDQGSLLIPYAHRIDEYRIEGKLTGNITPSHNLVAAYTTVDPKENNGEYFPAGELGVLDDIEAPHTILTFNYNGVLSSRLFVEAQYSRRDFRLRGQWIALCGFRPRHAGRRRLARLHLECDGGLRGRSRELRQQVLARQGVVPNVDREPRHTRPARRIRMVRKDDAGGLQLFRERVHRLEHERDHSGQSGVSRLRKRRGRASHPRVATHRAEIAGR